MYHIDIYDSITYIISLLASLFIILPESSNLFDFLLVNVLNSSFIGYNMILGIAAGACSFVLVCWNDTDWLCTLPIVMEAFWVACWPLNVILP